MSRRNLGLLIRCSLLVISLALAGYGSGTGAVKGRVTFRGKPVVSGAVVLLGANNKVVSGPLDTEGRYTINGVPLGKVQVAVVSPNPAPPPPRFLRGILKRREKEMKLLEEKTNVKDSPAPAAPKVDSSKWFPLPKQYELADTSGLTTTIHGGEEKKKGRDS
jgi:hypothetical protein